jgi:uncharacterized protein involved in outer membrane biogenesis
MRVVKRIFLGLLGVAVLLIVAGLLLRDGFLSKTLIQLARDKVGVDIRIESLRTGLLKPSLDLTGLSLMSPPDFPASETLRVERIRLVSDWKSLRAREIRAEEILLDIPCLVILRNAAGETNLQRLSRLIEERRKAAGPAGGGGKARPKTGPDRPKRTYRIDRLTVKIGEVQYVDYSKGGEPTTRIYPLNLDKTFTEVTDLKPVLQQLGQSAALAAAPGVLQDLQSLSEQAQKDPEGTKRALREMRDSFRGMLKPRPPQPETPGTANP